MHYRKCGHPRNIVCQYFLTNTGRRSSNQGERCWFRHYQLPLLLQMWQMLHQLRQHHSPHKHKLCLTLRHEPEPYVRTTATNGDHDATAETPTAKTAPGADTNDDDPDDELEYVNTETDNNIETKKRHSYDIDKQCSEQLLNATNVGTMSIPNIRLRKNEQFF